MNLDAAIRLFLDHRRRKRRSEGTLEHYSHQLNAWAAWRMAQGVGEDLADVTLEEFRTFFEYLTSEIRVRSGLRKDETGLSPRTTRAYYRTLRSFWRYLEFEEDSSGTAVLSPSQLRFFRNDRIGLPEIDVWEQPALPEEDYQRLLQATQQSDDVEERSRDEAILRLLWETGLRVHELAMLTHENVDLRGRTARIVGKGRKEAVVFWGPQAGAALARYLSVRRNRGRRGPLLRGASSRNPGGPITSNLVRLLLKRLADQCGVTLPPGSPCHSFRRAFARRARAAGATITEVGELLRDDTPAVIRSYIGLDTEVRRKLYNRIFGM